MYKEVAVRERELRGYGSVQPFINPYDIDGRYSEHGRPLSSDKSILRRGDPGAEEIRSDAINAFELVFIPWLVLALLLGCYLVAGANGQIFVLWAMPVVLLAVCAAFLRFAYKNRNTDELALGFLTLASIILGTGLGIYLNVVMLEELHRLNQGASYFNVLPTEAAAGKRDATSVTFTNSSTADFSRYFGYVDASRETATVYCVAPITDGSSSFTTVRYFAAGVNCCGAQEAFSCGRANGEQVHGAMRLSPELRTDHHLDMFDKAVNAAEAKYGLVTGDGYMLLDMISDPIAYTDDLWRRAYTLVIIFGCVYLFITAMTAFVVMPIIRGTA